MEDSYSSILKKLDNEDSVRENYKLVRTKKSQERINTVADSKIALKPRCKETSAIFGSTFTSN